VELDQRIRYVLFNGKLFLLISSCQDVSMQQDYEEYAKSLDAARIEAFKKVEQYLATTKPPYPITDIEKEFKLGFKGLIWNEFQVFRHKARLELQKNRDQINPSSLHYVLLYSLIAETCLSIMAKHDLMPRVERYYSMIE
jgi:hypothetical protein